MPEWAEVKLSAEVANRVLRDATRFEIILSEKTKNRINRVPKSFNSSSGIFKGEARAHSRGKEAQITFTQGQITRKLTITMGMTGCLLDNKQPTGHWKMGIKTDNGNVWLDDIRHFAKWKWRDYNFARSPDPIEEFELWKENLLNTKKIHLPIYIALLDQEIFNGVGNYLAAEIIGRIGANPFETLEYYLDNHQHELIEQVKYCLQKAYKYNGAKLYTYKNTSAQAQNWLQYYKSKDSLRVKAPNGRTFWINQKWKNQIPEKWQLK